MNKIKKIIKKIKDGFFQDAVSELRWIYQLLADYKWGIAGYTVLTLVSMVITLSFTLQTKTLVDNLVSGSWRGVLYVTVYYVGVGSVNVCLSMLTQRMSAKVSAKVKTEISVKTYRRIISADWEIVTEHHSGDLMTRMHEDIATIATSTVGWIPSVASQMIQIIISAGVIIYYDFSMLFIILLLLTRVLPVFHQVFHQFGTGVTGISKTLMDIGTAMNRYSVVFVVLFLLLAAAFLFFSRTTKGRELFLKAASKLRLSHGISDKTAACRFAGGMALTLRSGLTTASRSPSQAQSTISS